MNLNCVFISCVTFVLTVNLTFGMENEEVVFFNFLQKLYECKNKYSFDLVTLCIVDEIFVLKKIFSILQNIKDSIDVWSTRLEEQRGRQEDSSIFDVRVDDMPLKCKSDQWPRTCVEATSCTRRSGIYKILVQKFSNDPFLVECDLKTEGGGWTLVQRRQDGSVDFYRDWTEYQTGFGRIDGEFFIGLDKLHALTNYNGPQELLVVLEENNEIKQAKYSNFVIGNEHQLYALQHLGVYSGNAGDSLSYHIGMKFTTKDRDNDLHDNNLNCAQEFLGAWWYSKCHHSNLNAKYGDTRYAKGITWSTFRPMNVSITHVTMMIRRRRF